MYFYFFIVRIFTCAYPYFSYSHPYEYELDLFKPSEDQLKVCEPQIPKPLEEVPLILVKDIDTLNSMMEHLKSCSEIAVDLEVCCKIFTVEVINILHVFSW